MKVFYFTATGNSLKVAKALSNEVYSIPKLLKEGEVQFEDEVIGFVLPCYVGSIPTVVEEFLKKGKFKASYLFAIITYGNKAIGAASRFRAIAEKNGIKIDYTNKVKMVDTSLKYYDMEKQVEGLPKKRVDDQIKSIQNDINTKKNAYVKENILAKQLSKLGHRIYRKEIGGCDKLFNVENHCNGCKVCEKVCPVDNIKYEEKVVFNGNCIRCYACTQNCPSNAIRFKNEKSQVRYRNSDIILKEIIDSNT